MIGYGQSANWTNFNYRSISIGADLVVTSKLRFAITNRYFGEQSAEISGETRSPKFIVERGAAGRCI